jgi:hypothetical protein
MLTRWEKEMGALLEEMAGLMRGIVEEDLVPAMERGTLAAAPFTYAHDEEETCAAQGGETCAARAVENR